MNIKINAIECPNGTTSDTNYQFSCIKNDCIYSNIEKTECFENLPEGYYIFNEEEKIIDKCHENCKTCDKKEDINNNNCKTCKNGYFLEDGNCVTTCTYNSYIDDNGNNICTCPSNIKCKECSKESLKDDVCISCNNDGGFYSISYERLDDSFITCYTNFTGYYLVDNQYYPCFFLCHSCSKIDDISSHNCDECMNGYTLLNETDKKGNCYLKCNNYYYFDESNKYKCTDSNECPPLYNKLIPEKRKCINECSYDDTYKFEYNNTCYKKCPNNQICTNIIEENDITSEELTPQITQNEEIQSTETILINFPTNETQKITEELTLQITHNTDSVSINSNQINFSSISDIQKVTEERESQTTKITQYYIPIISDTQNVGDNWDSWNFFADLIEEKKLNISKDDIISIIKEGIISSYYNNKLYSI